MKVEKFKAARAKLLAKKKEQETQIDIEYTKICDAFVEENIAEKLHSVYEMVKGSGSKPKNFDRFIVYTRDIRFLGLDPIVTLGGWWLNSENLPEKWASYVVYGIANNTVFTLSSNQENKNHPKSED
jgi:hypothetical protein